MPERDPTDHDHPAAISDQEDGYLQFLAAMQATFDHEAQRLADPLLTVDTTGLFELFRDSLPTARRQHYTCNACRRWFRDHAGIVVVDELGALRSAVWPRVPREAAGESRSPLAAAAVNLRYVIEGRPVVGVHRCSDPIWGEPSAGGWSHFHLRPPPARVHRHPVESAAQWAARVREDRETLERGLREFDEATCRRAARMLEDGALYRSEKASAAARWLCDLHERRRRVEGAERVNAVTWAAAASAPAGWCHVRSGMIGTLLEDLASGMDDEGVARRWAEKMDPTRYQRPQAPPRAGNVEAAERLVERLGVAASLRRRFARLSDPEVEFAWRPAGEPTQSATSPTMTQDPGVFAEVARGARRGGPRPETTPAPVTMTWEKFARVVVPDAASMELLTPTGRAGFTALVTAADFAAPPVLQWDREGARNPVSWYCYAGGSVASEWGLPAGAWVEVTGLCVSPPHWRNQGSPNHAKGVVVLLRGARDEKAVRGHVGGGLFSENLRSELHAVRSTIEAHARSARVEGAERDDLCCGLAAQAGSAAWRDLLLRVRRRDGSTTVVRLDRWD